MMKINYNDAGDKKTTEAVMYVFLMMTNMCAFVDPKKEEADRTDCVIKTGKNDKK